MILSAKQLNLTFKSLHSSKQSFILQLKIILRYIVTFKAHDFFNKFLLFRIMSPFHFKQFDLFLEALNFVS